MAAMGAVRLRVSLVINVEGRTARNLGALGFVTAKGSPADVTSTVGSPGVSTPLTFSPYLLASVHYKSNSISPRRTLSVPFITPEDIVDVVG